MAYSIKRTKKSKAVARKLRHQRVRKRINGTPERPRLVVSRSNRHMVAQVVDDTIGHTLCAASTLEEAAKGVEGHKVGAAHKVASSWPSAPRRWASRRSSSTAVATSTTVAWRPSLRAPARPA